MVIKRKYLNGGYWNWINSYTSKIIRIDDIISGYLSLIKVDKVKYRLVVDYEDSSVCLFDDGYKCLIFLPDNEKWCVSAIYNIKNEIVEWYFDMTKQNSIDDQGNPFYDDLFLDIAVSPDFKTKILDEDELKEALDENIITDDDYKMAYETCYKLINEVIPNRELLCNTFYKCLNLLENNEC